MTLRRRSCVIGRGVAMFSICSAIAFASKMPTQIGSTRSPCLSLRITIGRLVTGSTISPLMDISMSMTLSAVGFEQRLARQAVRPGPADQHPHETPQPGLLASPRCIGRERDVHHGVPRRAARDLPGLTAADGIDQHLDHRAYRRVVEPGLDVALQSL